MKVISSKDGLTAREVNPYEKEIPTYDKHGKIDGGYINNDWVDFEKSHVVWLKLTQPMPGETVFEVEEVRQLQMLNEEWLTVNYNISTFKFKRKAYQPHATPIKEVANEEKAKVKIEKQDDGGFVLTDLSSGNSAYSGGLDGVIKIYCAMLKYPVEYLIEDLKDDKVDN